MTIIVNSVILYGMILGIICALFIGIFLTYSRSLLPITGYKFTWNSFKLTYKKLVIWFVLIGGLAGLVFTSL